MRLKSGLKGGRLSRQNHLRKLAIGDIVGRAVHFVSAACVLVPEITLDPHFSTDAWNHAEEVRL